MRSFANKQEQMQSKRGFKVVNLYNLYKKYSKKQI